jgi:hypothetical protein
LIGRYVVQEIMEQSLVFDLGQAIKST